MIITLTGNNAFALKQALSKYVDTFVDKYGGLSVQQLDAEETDFEHIFDALTTLSMFTEAKLVVVRNIATNRELMDSLENLVSQVPDSTTVIFVAAKLDKRQKTYKFLQQKTSFEEFTEQAVPNMPQWIIETASQLGGHIDQATARYLVEQLGTNQTKLHNELAKLVTYDKAISRQTIDLLCEPLPQSTIFQLLDAAFGGHAQRAITLYQDQRRQRVEPHTIIGMIAWQLHILALIKAAKNVRPDQLANEAKLNTFVVKKSVAIAAKMTNTQLARCIRQTLELDIQLKTAGGNVDDAMQHYLLALAK